MYSPTCTIISHILLAVLVNVQTNKLYLWKQSQKSLKGKKKGEFFAGPETEENIQLKKDASFLTWLKFFWMHSFLLSYEASLRGRWLCNTWLLRGWAVRAFSMISTGINKRKQEPLQGIKLSKQKQIQSYHYWTHNDLSPFLHLKCLQLFQHKKDLSKRFIFKPPCQSS